MKSPIQSFPIYKVFSIACLFVFCVMLDVKAQCTVEGTIKNMENKSMPSATIKLLKPDSTYIRSTFSDDAGFYQLEDMQAGKYLLQISYIGYKATIYSFSVEQPRTVLPDILLENQYVMLDAVEVKAQSVIRKDDYLLIIPDKQQVKHSFSGYDLLYNLMIPGMEVDRRTGLTSTMGGVVTMYINGRKADFREFRNVRPKDVLRIEYHDIPTGKYTGDVASVNYIVKEYTSGGYANLDGEQTIGYLKGDYNAATKISCGNTSYSIYVGAKKQQYNNNKEEQSDEIFLFPEETITKTSETDFARVKNNQQYAQLNIVDQTPKRTLSAQAAFVRQAVPENDRESSIRYSSLYTGEYSNSMVDQQSFMPSLNLRGSFQLENNQYLEASLLASYNRNRYHRTYMENDFQSLSNVHEDLYVLSPSLKYQISLKHKRTLGARLHHNYRVTSADYTGSHASWQHLWSAETLFFLDYNQRINKKVRFDGYIGFSSLQYRLHNQKQTNHLSPRACVSWTFQFTRNQMFSIGTVLGNAYPELNTINTAEQYVDRLHVRCGNPDLSKITMYDINSSYSLQFGRFNLFSVMMYSAEINATFPYYYMENGQLVETFRSNGDYHSIRVGTDLTWKATDALRLRVSGRWQSGLIRGERDDTQNNLFVRLNFNYFWKDFAFNVYGETQRHTLNENGVHERKDGYYGVSIGWNHGNWAIETGAENPFVRSRKTYSFMDSDVYRYDRFVCIRPEQQFCYVKLAYTFDFGRKISRDNRDVNTNINSAILKAN